MPFICRVKECNRKAHVTSRSLSVRDSCICLSICERCSITRVFSYVNAEISLSCWTHKHHMTWPERQTNSNTTHDVTTHHLHHLHLSVQPEVIEEHLQVFLHLDAVVVHLSHREDAHLAFPPHLRDTKHFKADKRSIRLYTGTKLKHHDITHLVLSQQERKQH